jgi:hypothetical protein
MAFRIDENLKKTDEACIGWARERRETRQSIRCTLDALQMAKADIVAEGPLEMSEISMSIDKIFLSAPGLEKNVLIVWYCDSAPVYLKAKRLAVPRSQLYVQWRETLQYVRGRLHGMGHDV